MYKLLQGDCLDLMNKIPDKSIDAIICDLPYGVTACDWDNQLNFEKLWEQYNRIAKENAPVILFSSMPFTVDVINSNRKNFKYCWYWVKNQGTNFFHAKRMPIRKVEEICVFNSKIYYPQITDGHVPTNSAKGYSNGNIYHGDNKRNYEGGSTKRYPTNILEFKCVDNYHRLHPNEKPVELLEYLVKTYTNDGDLILDNCMGSGSTGVAALNLNRSFIGMELDENYFNIANERIESLQKDKVISK